MAKRKINYTRFGKAGNNILVYDKSGVPIAFVSEAEIKKAQKKMRKLS